MDTSEKTQQTIKAPLIRVVMMRFLQVYRLLISPFFGQRCRFEPTCSRYMEQAVLELGVIKGFILGLRRIGRCHPWNEGGYDPVPSSKTVRKSHDADHDSVTCSHSSHS